MESNWVCKASLIRKYMYCKMCVCMYVCLLTYSWNFKLNKRIWGYTYISNLDTWSLVQCKLTWCTPHYLTPCRWMRQRTPHHVTQCRWIYWVQETDCVWSKRKGLLLDCSVGAKVNLRWSEQTEVRQASLDRRCVHGEESSVAYSQ